MLIAAEKSSNSHHEERRQPTLGGSPLVLDRSLALLEEARQLIPGVTQSWMKRPEMFALSSYPVYLADGQGALVTDVDGQTYIDFICGLGANTLGHNHARVVSAIQGALGHGILHSLPAPMEIDATRELIAIIPGAQMARFFKTGADATSAAVRLARHLTGKERIVTVGYNGWHDHFMFDTKGVPAVFKDYTFRMPLMRAEDEEPLLSLIENRCDEIALLLLSLPYNRVVSRDYLSRLRELCAQKNVLFVFDEVVTGFRLALGGAQQFYGIEADFVCLSKGIAAGMPLSAVAGPRRTLAALAELQVSTTFGGELLSLAACRAAISVYKSTDYIAHLKQLGERLANGVNSFAEERGHDLRIVGYPAIPLFRFSPDMAEQARKAEPFVAAMAKRGVLLRRDVSFISGVHSEAQIDHTIAACQESLTELAARS